MPRILIVTNDFADFKRGDKITDPAQIADIEQGGNQSNVVGVHVPDVMPEPTAEVQH